MNADPHAVPHGRRRRAKETRVVPAGRPSASADMLLTVTQVCASLEVSRRTFYEWRAKSKAPRCIALPNGSLRIRRSEYQRWLASREAS